MTRELIQTLLLFKLCTEGMRNMDVVHCDFLLRIRVNRDPRFCTIVVIAAFGSEDQPSLVQGICTWALAVWVAQFILPAVHLAVPHQHWLPARHFAAVERNASISCAMVTIAFKFLLLI